MATCTLKVEGTHLERNILAKTIEDMLRRHGYVVKLVNDHELLVLNPINNG